MNNSSLFIKTRKSIKAWVNQQQEKSDESTVICMSEKLKLAGISYNMDSDTMALSCCFFNITFGFEASVKAQQFSMYML